jgi:hypothetical protein
MFFRFGMDRRLIHARLHETILRVLESRCNHFDRCQQPMSIQSIARFASDPWFQVSIGHCRLHVGFHSALPSVCMMVFKFENAGGNGAAAKKQ